MKKEGKFTHINNYVTLKKRCQERQIAVKKSILVL